MTAEGHDGSGTTILNESTLLMPPVQPGEGVTEGVLRRLTETINLGILRPGDQLPSEVDLAKQFAVSAVTVRSALAALRSSGMIETRRGRNGGSFVAEGAGDPERFATEYLASLTPIQLVDLVDEVAAIDEKAAALAAERATESRIERLSGLIERQSRASDAGERALLDARFHIEVTVAARATRLMQRLAPLMIPSVRARWLDNTDDRHRKCIDEHAAIVDAVAAGDPGAARSAAEQHMKTELDVLLAIQARRFE